MLELQKLQHIRFSVVLLQLKDLLTKCCHRKVCCLFVWLMQKVVTSYFTTWEICFCAADVCLCLPSTKTAIPRCVAVCIHAMMLTLSPLTKKEARKSKHCYERCTYFQVVDIQWKCHRLLSLWRRVYELWFSFVQIISLEMEQPIWNDGFKVNCGFLFEKKKQNLKSSVLFALGFVELMTLLGCINHLQCIQPQIWV